MQGKVKTSDGEKVMMAWLQPFKLNRMI